DPSKAKNACAWPEAAHVGRREQTRPNPREVSGDSTLAQPSLYGVAMRNLRSSASSPCLYRVTVPVNVERTGEPGFGPYTASLFPLPLSPSNSPVPLTIVQTPFCGV